MVNRVHLFFVLFLVIQPCFVLAQKRTVPEMVVQQGHSDQVSSVAFTPDGQYFLSGSMDNTMKLWHISSGRVIRIFSGHGGHVTSVAVSSDGKYVLSGSQDGSVKLWDIETGKLLYSYFFGSSHLIFSVEFSPDDKLVVAGTCKGWSGGRGVVVVWDRISGKKLKVFNGHRDRVTSVNFSPNGKYILSGSWDHTMKLWDVEQEKEIRTFSEHVSWGNSVSFSPDGKFLLSGSTDYSIKLWDITDGSEIRCFKGSKDCINSVDFSPDGKFIISAGDDLTLRLWEVETGNEAGQFSGHSDTILQAIFSPDGQYVLSCSRDNTIKYWDLNQELEEEYLAGHSGAVLSVAVSSQGNYILSGSSDNDAILWDYNKRLKLRTFTGHEYSVTAVAFSSEERLAVSGSADGTIKVWDIFTGKEIQTFTGHNGTVISVAFSIDGNFIFSGSWDNTIRIWEKKSGKEVSIINDIQDGNPEGLSVAFSSNGEYAVVGSPDNTIKIWNVPKGEIINSFNGHKDSVTAVDISDDGKVVVSGSADNTVKVWNTSYDRESYTFDGHDHDVLSVTISSDGRYILSSSKDELVKLWDIDERCEIRTFSGHSDYAFSADFSPAGNYIVFADKNKTITIWDNNSGREVRTFTGNSINIDSADLSLNEEFLLSGFWNGAIGLWDLRKLILKHTFSSHSDRVKSVAFSPDGIHAASGSVDGTVILWDIKRDCELSTVSKSESAVYEPLVDVSPNGKYLLYVQNRIIHIRDLEKTLNPSWIIKQNNYLRASVFCPDSEKILAGNEDGTMKLWCFKTGQNIRTFKGHTGFVESIEISADGQFILSGSADRTVRLWDAENADEIYILRGHPDHIMSVALSHDTKRAASGDMDSNLLVWDIEAGQLLRKFTGHTRAISSVSFLSDNNYVLSGSWDGTTRIWNIETGEWVAFMTNSDGTEWLIYDSEGYWDASPLGGDLVAMVNGMECWNIDQFAVRNNRPDLILKKLPTADSELINYCYSQYQKRLRRLGLTEADLGEEYHVPRAEIINTNKDGKTITLDLLFSDSKEQLKSYQIYVNDVPLFGANGKEIDGEIKALIETIELTSGRNKIEVSCMNSAGAESFRSLTLATYDETVEMDLYFIGFGVSKYKDSSLNLEFADKDVRDIASLLESRTEAYRNIYIHTFTNEEATTENITRARDLLKNSRPDDTLVLFIAGHGVHDDDPEATYYYLTHETDLDNLSGTAANFDLLENILQGIPPRNKLFLMDTCESGEIDDEMIAYRDNLERQSRSVRARAVVVQETEGTGGTAGSQSVLQGEKVREYLFERDRYIYNDLLRRSGTIVFSSCRGGEYSYEDVSLKNGFFTYKIKEAIGEMLADDDGDGVVTTEELQSFVSKEVSYMSDGLQNPTVDRDNIYVDFGF